MDLIGRNNNIDCIKSEFCADKACIVNIFVCIIYFELHNWIYYTRLTESQNFSATYFFQGKKFFSVKLVEKKILATSGKGRDNITPILHALEILPCVLNISNSAIEFIHIRVI